VTGFIPLAENTGSPNSAASSTDRSAVAEPCQILIFGCRGWGWTSASVSGVFLIEATPSGGAQVTLCPDHSWRSRRSSGALYPALRRLEAKGLVRADPDTASKSARHRRVYELTQAVRAAHVTWLRMPVAPATAAHDLGLHLMRFVMMENMVPREEVLGFLHDLRDALAAFVAELERYPAIAHVNELHPRFALDHGLAVHRASLDWAERTIAELRRPADGQPHALQAKCPGLLRRQVYHS